MQSFHVIAHSGEGLWSIDLLFNLLWKSSLLWIAILALSKSSVARRAQWIWRIGLLGFLVLFLFCTSAPWEIQTYAPVSASVSDTFESQASEVAVFRADQAYPVVHDPPIYAKLSGRFDTILIGIWLVGFLIIIGKALLEFGLLQYADRKAGLFDARSTEVDERQLAQLVGLSFSPKILLSNSIPVPITYGWKKPVILLPVQARTWEKERLRQVLLHELIHIQNKDYLFNIFAVIVKALYWFNPLTYVLLRQFHLIKEWACDEQVIELGINKFTYAENLLAIAALTPAPQNNQLALPFTRSGTLRARIRRILTKTTQTASPDRYKLLPIPALFLLFLIMLSTNLRTIAHKPYSAKTYHQTIEGLTTDDDAQKIRGLHQLGQWGLRTSFQQIKPFAKDRNPAVRMQALSALQRIACLPAFCLISQQLQDQDQAIKQHADDLLNTYPGSKLRAYLLDYLDEPSMENWFIQYFRQIREVGQTERLAIHLSAGNTELQFKIQQQLMHPQQADALAQLEKLLRD